MEDSQRIYSNDIGFIPTGGDVFRLYKLINENGKIQRMVTIICGVCQNNFEIESYKYTSPNCYNCHKNIQYVKLAACNKIRCFNNIKSFEYDVIFEIDDDHTIFSLYNTLISVKCINPGCVGNVNHRNMNKTYRRYKRILNGQVNKPCGCAIPAGAAFN